MDVNPNIADRLARQNYLQGNRSVKLEAYRQPDPAKEALKGIDIVRGQKELGKNDFLKILVTQLSHQDPTKPLKDTNFIAQMAQFSSLEQMNNLSKEVQKMRSHQSVNLVGQHIIGNDFETGAQIFGTARAVFFDKTGKPFVRLEKGVVSYDDVQSVTAPPPQKEKPAPAIPPAMTAPPVTPPGPGPNNGNSMGVPAGNPGLVAPVPAKGAPDSQQLLNQTLEKPAAAPSSEDVGKEVPGYGTTSKEKPETADSESSP